MYSSCSFMYDISVPNMPIIKYIHIHIYIYMYVLYVS